MKAYFARPKRKFANQWRWLRPSQFMVGGAKDFKVFIADPSPNQINQGSLGDCYFLSALAAISSRKPEVIKRLFIS
jgi:hypothetical protein